MSNSTTESSKDEAIIDEVEVTSDTLTGRGGLSLFVRYLRLFLQKNPTLWAKSVV
jgi:hypothetical protein